MESSGKLRLKLEDLASDLAAKMVLQYIKWRELEDLKTWGVNPESSKHRQEIMILSLYSLKSAISIVQQSSAFDQDKGSELLVYVEQYLKYSYANVLTLGDTDQFENLLRSRYEEYEGRDTPGPTIPRIGLRFSRNIGIDDMAIVYWADTTFRNVRQMYVHILKTMSDGYDLIY